MPLIAAFTDVMGIGRTGIIVTSISGLLYLTAIYFYLRALQQEEASVIAPLFQTSTLFTYIIAYFVLHETLTGWRIVGGLLVMASAVGRRPMSPEQRRTVQMERRGADPRLHRDARGIVGDVQILRDPGCVLAGDVLELRGPGRVRRGAARDPAHPPPVLRHVRANIPARCIGINAANEIINLGGGLAARYASLLGPVSLVQAIGGTTSFFVFAFGVVLSLFFPKLGRENLSRRNLIQKGIAVTLIVAGVILIGGDTTH